MLHPIRTTDVPTSDFSDATFNALYTSVLFAHLDRLGDPCDAVDPLPKIVADLLNAAAVIMETDPAMLGPSPAMAAREGEPWLPVGTVVWFQGRLRMRGPRHEGTVRLSFMGKDRNVWCLVESTHEGRTDYDAMPVVGLALTQDGETLLREAMKNPAYARRFLQSAGILDESGTLAAAYRPER